MARRNGFAVLVWFSDVDPKIIPTWSSIHFAWIAAAPDVIFGVTITIPYSSVIKINIIYF